MHRVFIVLAVAAAILALAAPALWPSPQEKPGVFYALGHWWDRALEVQLPLIAFAIVSVVLAIRSARWQMSS